MYNVFYDNIAQSCVHCKCVHYGQTSIYTWSTCQPDKVQHSSHQEWMVHPPWSQKLYRTLLQLRIHRQYITPNYLYSCWSYRNPCFLLHKKILWCVDISDVSMVAVLFPYRIVYWLHVSLMWTVNPPGRCTSTKPIHGVCVYWWTHMLYRFSQTT